MSMPPIEDMNNQFNAGARARRAQRQGSEDQSAEEAALARTEIERNRKEEVAREAENRAAQHEAFQAEQQEESNRPRPVNQQEDFSPEEAALARTEADRASAATAAREAEKGAAQNEAFEAEQQQAAADAARLPIHEQRRIAREQAAQREREEGERLERELTRLEDAYAQAYGQAKARQNLIKRALGLGNIENDPIVEQAREAYAAARGNYNNFRVGQLESKQGTISDAEFKQETAKLAGEIFQGHDLRLQTKKLEHRKLENLRRGWFSRAVENGWNKMTDAYRKLPTKYKLAIAAGLVVLGPGIGMIGIAGMGYTGLSVAGLTGMRIMGSFASMKGTQEGLQAGADWWRKRRAGSENKNVQDILNLEGVSTTEKFNALRGIVGRHNATLDGKFVGWERGDNARKLAGLGVGVLVGTGVASNYIRETIGDWWTGKGGGGTGMTPEAAAPKGFPHPGGPPMGEVPIEGPEDHLVPPDKLPDGLYDADGKLTPKGDEYFKKFNIEPFDSPPKGPSVIEQAANSPATGAGPSAIEQAANSPMTGAEIPGSAHELIRDPSAMIESGSNIWKTTRDLYMENPGKFGYDANDPKIGRLFESFKSQGILDKMGIDADSFADLSDEEKLKIWAENRTANSVNKLSQLQGGRIRDLVHPGDTVTLKPDGSIIFNADSGIKSGYLSGAEARGGGGGAYEPGGRGSAAAVQETGGRQGITRSPGEIEAQARLDENARIRRETLNPEYQAASAQEGAMLDLRSNYTLLNKMMDDSMGAGFNLSDKVEDVAQNARSFATLPGGQMPETLTAAELDLRSKSANLFNDLFRRFPYQPGQRMDDYLSKISNTDMLKLRKLYRL